MYCPELVIVDEAHTCVAPASVAKSSQAHLRYALLRKLADDPDRHLLLLTATPHSGDDAAWQSLIGLLDDRLAEPPADLSGRDRENDRKLLAGFMIQRQRADIREYLHEDTQFPEREVTETSYRLTPAYRALFDEVVAFAREQVADPKLSSVHQRVRWWSAIALPRCLASSPAAAEQTLLNRSTLTAADSTDEVDEFAESRVLDTDLDDTTEGEDAALGSDTTHPDTTTGKTRRRLRELAATAAALKGPKTDAKLKRLTPLINDLLARGYHPIIFCRYIPNRRLPRRTPARRPGFQEPPPADRGRHRDAAPRGTRGPRRRPHRPRRAAAADRHRLPVGGHQPAGRLHRGGPLRPGLEPHPPRTARGPRRPFGQNADTVRTVTYYGEDNGIDGIVLQVLIRRHENIRRSTGVSVPVPVDSTTVMKAIWESLLLRGKQADQLTLDFADATSESLADQVEVQWTTFGAGAPVSASSSTAAIRCSSGTATHRRGLRPGGARLLSSPPRPGDATESKTGEIAYTPKGLLLEAGAARRPARLSAW